MPCIIKEDELHYHWDEAVAARRRVVPAVMNHHGIYIIETIVYKAHVLMAHVHINGHPATLLRLQNNTVAIFRGVVSPDEIHERRPESFAQNWSDALSAVSKGDQEHAFYWPAKRMPLDNSGERRVQHYVVWRDKFIPIRMFTGGFQFNIGTETFRFAEAPWKKGREIAIALEAAGGAGEGREVIDILMEEDDSPFVAPPPPVEAAHPLFGML